MSKVSCQNKKCLHYGTWLSLFFISIAESILLSFRMKTQRRLILLLHCHYTSREAEPSGLSLLRPWCHFLFGPLVWVEHWLCFTSLSRVFKARCEAVTAELMFPRGAHRKRWGACCNWPADVKRQRNWARAVASAVWACLRTAGGQKKKHKTKQNRAEIWLECITASSQSTNCCLLDLLGLSSLSSAGTNLALESPLRGLVLPSKSSLPVSV